MALYAYDEQGLIFAGNAEEKKIYTCIDCCKPVKLRKGPKNLYHFYHCKSTSACRLYSKSEDHLIAQLQIQSLFSDEGAQMERSFPQIRRVADVCLEHKKVVFEIQCSLITEFEVEKRERDYKSMGFEIIWLLDDRLFNKKILKPGEKLLREHSCYYFTLKREAKQSLYYDQFEVFLESRRKLKGRKFPLDLKKFEPIDKEKIQKIKAPKQVKNIRGAYCIRNDRTFRAYWNHPTLSFWIEKEKTIPKMRVSLFKKMIDQWFLKPYERFLDRQILKVGKIRVRANRYRKRKAAKIGCKSQRQ